MEVKNNCCTTYDREPLLRMAMNGDREALSELFGRYMGRLYPVALRLLRRPEDAEEALQDGLLAAVRHLREFKGRSQFSTWLTRIVINAALMRLRRNRHEAMTSSDQELNRDDQPLTGKIADPGPNPEEMCVREERFQILEQTWQGLPEAYRSALSLFYVEGMRIKEAAEVLGLPEETLRARLHRGRLRIIKQVRNALVLRGTSSTLQAAQLGNGTARP